jgi:putative oxidoreductase
MNSDLGKLLLRFTLGGLILLHGLFKLKNGIGPIEGLVVAHHLPKFVAYGAYVGEVLAPLLVIIGLFARVGGLIIAIHLAFALALVHTAELSKLNAGGGWAIELQALYLATGLVIALIGPGRYAVNDR